ncbi:hypothetical protein E2C01_087903 [Portunus trituberculatus]|uniref:Uncharacterized protein n=1 Tax=Portunus trituberculatus TaxID=210409 RepID=A0A5B7JDY7_PORTR|nr:hypothetical protein [Portunus trituberculatus]
MSKWLMNEEKMRQGEVGFLTPQVSAQPWLDEGRLEATGTYLLTLSLDRVVLLGLTRPLHPEIKPSKAEPKQPQSSWVLVSVSTFLHLSLFRPLYKSGAG